MDYHKSSFVMNHRENIAYIESKLPCRLETHDTGNSNAHVKAGLESSNM
jgi:hypothetical protein